MKNFIEVTVGNSKSLININTISVVQTTSTGKTEIILLPPGEKRSRYVEPKETYAQIKALIQESL